MATTESVESSEDTLAYDPSTYRERLLREIQLLLPDEQTYVNFDLPYCPSLKYIGPSWSDCAFAEARRNQLEIGCISDAPLETLWSLYRQLKERSLCKKQVQATRK